VFGVVVGLYQPLADDERNPIIRPYLSSAVASEDKEKSFSDFSLASLAGEAGTGWRPKAASHPSALLT